MNSRVAKYSVKVDCGCGDRKVEEKCIGIDVRRTNAVDIVAYLLFLPIKAKCVDTLYARSVIEHFHNPYGFLEEAHRVLKSDGVMMMWVPNTGSCGAHLAQQHPAGHKFLGDYALWKWILKGFFMEVEGTGVGIKFRSCPTYFRVIQQVLVRIGFYDFAYDLFFVCRKLRDKVEYNYPIWWAGKYNIDKDAYSTLKCTGKK
jgi:SAM-dependent methyltransferase